MLFVLFGTIGDFGVKCRNYFEEKYKFKYIEKKIYDSKNPDLRGEVDGKFYGSLTAVKKCDFWYENKKRVIGFNFNQIESAVRGKENCLLTLSAHNIKLLRQLKATYGDYVTVICAYIDGLELEKMTIDRVGLTPEDIESRIVMGKEIKRLYIDYRKDFDDMVVYAGEESVFNFESLFKQFDFIYKKSLEKERKLNDKNYIDLPYEGREPYVFVSYSQKDGSIVKPFLEILRQNGCRVWYDKGIPKGVDWEIFLRDKIKRSKMILLFVSKNSMSKRSYVKKEMNIAKVLGVKMVAVRLDETDIDKEYVSVITKYQYIVSNEETFNRDEMEKYLLEAVDKKTIISKTDKK